MTYHDTAQPHTGIATFCKAPYVQVLEGTEADVVVVGVPYDGATAMRPGSRQAPRAIRDASTRFGFLGRGRLNAGLGTVESTVLKMVRRELREQEIAK